MRLHCRKTLFASILLLRENIATLLLLLLLPLMGRRSWWLLMAILTVTMALLHLTLFSLSSSSHGLQRQYMESSKQNKHEPWILSPDMESARQVPTGPDPIHHSQAPPSHHFP